MGIAANLQYRDVVGVISTSRRQRILSKIAQLGGRIEAESLDELMSKLKEALASCLKKEEE